MSRKIKPGDKVRLIGKVPFGEPYKIDAFVASAELLPVFDDEPDGDKILVVKLENTEGEFVQNWREGFKDRFNRTPVGSWSEYFVRT